MNNGTSPETNPAKHANAVQAAKKPRRRRMARSSGNTEPLPKTTPEPPQAPKLAGGTIRAPSKISSVVALLERAEGATLHEMVEATGWLPHTTRAALTGLRKKGSAITKAKVDGVTRYSIAAAT